MTQASLALRANQQTTLTPRLQQSVRLLQLSSNDFIQEIEQALVSNPFLELAATAEGEAPEGDGADGTDWDGESAPSTDDRTSAAADGADERMADVAVERVDADDSEFRTHDAPSSGDGSRTPGTTDLGSWIEASASLRDHLHGELGAYRLDDRDRAIATLAIEAIDDDGYLRQELRDVVDRFPFDPPVDDDELSIALKLVQQLGPVGVAARSVAECLTLQLGELTAHAADDEALRTVRVAVTIVRDALELFAAHDWPALRRRIGCTPEEITAATALIRSLDPRPGSAYGGEVARVIVPDVIVRRTRGAWRADINPAVVPRVGLNRSYARMFHQSRGGDRAPLSQQLQEARWLLRNAEQRFVTIERVARLIVVEQAAFFDYGDIAIKPLLLRDIADRLGLHESTISRAIGNKYMSTPRGIIEFKHFFARKLATVSGGSCSSTSIRAAIRELIEGEDPGAPMSDVSLARCLGEQGLCVARRTVTKYRGLMRIPQVEMRRAPA